MKKQQIQSATSLPQSPDAERRVRMIKYLVAMAIRLVCFIVAIFIHNVWAIIPIALAIVLPYVAVVLANTVVQDRGPKVERPGGLVPVALPRAGHDS